MDQEARWVAQLKQGDAAAFELLFAPYFATTYRLCLGILGNTHDADDVVQETFLRAFRSFRTYDPHQPLYPWLRSIAIRQSLSFQHKVRTRRETLVADVPDRSESTAETGHETLVWALQGLPRQLRVVVWLYYGEDMPIQEIAQALHCPVGTIKSRLHHARQRLLSLLQSDVPSEKGGVAHVRPAPRS